MNEKGKYKLVNIKQTNFMMYEKGMKNASNLICKSKLKGFTKIKTPFDCKRLI